jgi:hypothetical protein
LKRHGEVTAGRRALAEWILRRSSSNRRFCEQIPGIKKAPEGAFLFEAAANYFETTRTISRHLLE